MLARPVERSRFAAAGPDFDHPFRTQAALDALQTVAGRARDGSTQPATAMRLWRQACCRYSYATSGSYPCPQRVGAFRGRLLTSRVRPPAPPVPTRVSTHAMTAGTTHDSMTGQRISYEALCLGSNDSCELSNILLTALARTAQWTGVFVAALVALACSEAVTAVASIDRVCVRSR